MLFRLLPLLQREKKGPIAKRNGEMRGRRDKPLMRETLPLTYPDCVGAPSSPAVRERTRMHHSANAAAISRRV